MGFNELARAMTRQPMPLVIMRMNIDVVMFLASPWEMRMCVALMYALYRRPVDVISMRLEDFATMLMGAGAGRSRRSAVLRPAEGCSCRRRGFTTRH